MNGCEICVIAWHACERSVMSPSHLDAVVALQFEAPDGKFSEDLKGRVSRSFKPADAKKAPELAVSASCCIPQTAFFGGCEWLRRAVRVSCDNMASDIASLVAHNSHTLPYHTHTSPHMHACKHGRIHSSMCLWLAPSARVRVQTYVDRMSSIMSAAVGGADEDLVLETPHTVRVKCPVTLALMKEPVFK